MTLTLKATGEHQAPWVTVPDGAPEEQKAYLVELFGLDITTCTDKTTYEVFMECDAIHRATYLAAKRLGGTPVSVSYTDAGQGWPANGEQSAAEQSPAEAAPQAAPEAPKEQHKFQGVLDKIAAAESKADVQKVFLSHKAAFQDPDVAAAAKAKTEELA